MSKIIAAASALRAIQGKVAADTIFRVPPSLLQIEQGYNVRTFSPDTNPDHQELLASIGVIGVRTPIVVRMVDGKPTIVQGHMRHAAVLMHNATDGIADTAKILAIPARLANADDTDADRALDILTSNSGIPLAQIERGHAVLRLRSLGWTDAAISSKAGMTIRTFQEAVKLAKADPAIVKLVKGYVTGLKNLAGKPVVVKVSDTLATQTMTMAGPDAAAVLVEAAKLAEAAAPALAASGSSKAGNIVASHVAAAAATVAAAKGSPLVNNKGVASTKGRNVKVPVLAVNPAAVNAILAKGKAKAPARIASGLPVRLRGPFTCKIDGSIVDDIGELIAIAAPIDVGAETWSALDIGNELCRYLNSAYATFAVDKMVSTGLSSPRNATGPLQGVKGSVATTTPAPVKAGKSGSSQHATR